MGLSFDDVAALERREMAKYPAQWLLKHLERYDPQPYAIRIKTSWLALSDAELLDTQLEPMDFWLGFGEQGEKLDPLFLEDEDDDELTPLSQYFIDVQDGRLTTPQHLEGMFKFVGMVEPRESYWSWVVTLKDLRAFVAEPAPQFQRI